MERIRSKHIDLGRLANFVVSNTEYDRWRCSASYSAALAKTVYIYSSEQFSPSSVLGLTLPFPPFPPRMPDFILASTLKQFPLPVKHTQICECKTIRIVFPSTSYAYCD